MIQQITELEAAHERLMAQIATEQETQETPEESLSYQVREQIRIEHVTAQHRLKHELELCIQRDKLQAERPDGCFCLGAGGRGHLLPFLNHPVWTEPCNCAIGQAQQLRHQEYETAIALERLKEDQKGAHADYLARLGNANIPPRIQDMSYDAFAQTNGKQRALTALRSLMPTRKNRGVYLFGAGGTGKTTLVGIAVRQWIKDGGSALFMPVADLLDALRPGGDRMAEEVADNQAHLMQRLLGTGLLALDDLGSERITGWSRERLFLILNRRYDRNRLTIITSNYDLTTMGQRLAGTDEEVEGTRIAWRIKETCELIELGGINYRAVNDPQNQPIRFSQRSR